MKTRIHQLHARLSPLDRSALILLARLQVNAASGQLRASGVKAINEADSEMLDACLVVLEKITFTVRK